MTRGRSGFRGRSRAIEGDSVRTRRADQLIPLGNGLEWVNGKLSLRTTGALTTQNGTLELEVLPPLAQSSPLRLETDGTTTGVNSDGQLVALPSTSEGSGVAPRSLVRVSRDYVMTTRDEIVLADASIANVTITLPPGTSGLTRYVKRIDKSGANSVTVASQRDAKIDDDTETVTLTALEGLTLAFDDGWWIL